MSKTAFIFPGQGAQYIGMGKDFYERTQTGKKIFNAASETIGLDLKALCFEENEKINITEYTQAAVLTASVAMMSVFQENHIKPDITAGLSLGEYSALVAAGAMNFEDAVKVVRQRGILMQEAVPPGIGGMAAVLNMDAEKIEAVLSEMEGIQIANYNCPGQIVISGYKEAVEEAGMRLKEAGARRIIPLNVSGPFHSTLLEGAGKKLNNVLEEISLKDPVIPYVANATAAFVTSKSDIASLLVKQVSSSVRWQQSMECMLADGVDTFIEIGPGKTLSGFMKKINKEVLMLNIETLEDIPKVLEAL